MYVRYLSHTLCNGVLFRIHTFIVFVFISFDAFKGRFGREHKMCFSKEYEKRLHFLFVSFRDGHKMQCTNSSYSSCVFFFFFFIFPQLNAKVNAHVEFNRFTLKLCRFQSLSLCVCVFLYVEDCLNLSKCT